MGYRRVFRRHKLTSLVVPGLPWSAAILLIMSACLFLLTLSTLASWLLLLIPFPGFKLLQLYLDWLAYSVVAVAGSDVLAERSGIVKTRQRLIPLASFLPLEHERPRWASWLGLDFGDIRIGGMGGPFLLRGMGDFEDLWRVLESRGQDVPLKRPSALVTLAGWFWRTVRAATRCSLSKLAALVRFLVRLGRSAQDWLARGLRALVVPTGHARPAMPHAPPEHRFQFATPRPHAHRAPAQRQQRRREQQHVARNRGYVYRGTRFSRHRASVAGFYAFSEQFVLTGSWARWVYRAADSRRQYYPNGIGERVAAFYLEQLRQRAILIPGGGRERLSARIRSIQDIQRLIEDSFEPSGTVA